APEETNPTATAFHWSSFVKEDIWMINDKDGYYWDSALRLWRDCTEQLAVTRLIGVIDVVCSSNKWKNRWTQRTSAVSLFRVTRVVLRSQNMLPFLIRTDDDGQSFQVNKRYPKCCPIANGILIDLESCTSMSRDRHHRFSIEY